MTDLQTELAELARKIPPPDDVALRLRDPREWQMVAMFIAERLAASFQQVGRRGPRTGALLEDDPADARAAWEPVYRFVRPESSEGDA